MALRMKLMNYIKAGSRARVTSSVRSFRFGSASVPARFDLPRPMSHLPVEERQSPVVAAAINSTVSASGKPITFVTLPSTRSTNTPAAPWMP